MIFGMSKTDISIAFSSFSRPVEESSETKVEGGRLYFNQNKIKRHEGYKLQIFRPKKTTLNSLKSRSDILPRMNVQLERISSRVLKTSTLF